MMNDDQPCRPGDETRKQELIVRECTVARDAIERSCQEERGAEQTDQDHERAEETRRRAIVRACAVNSRKAAGRCHLAVCRRAAQVLSWLSAALTSFRTLVMTRDCGFLNCHNDAQTSSSRCF